MKKKPLHEIKFEQHVLTRDQTGGRKRKVPQEVNSSYMSKPAGEPAIDTAYVEAFKSVSMRKPGRTRQEVIQFKSPILFKLGTNVGFGE